MDWVVLGRFGRVHGIKGYIKIHSFTEPPENILSFTPLYISVDNEWKILNFSDVIANEQSILVKVDGYNSREHVAQLTNKVIGVEARQLPPLDDNEYYWYELIGLDVINQANDYLGKVTELMATGSNDVLVVMGEKRHLIPYLIGQFVCEIDRANKKIIVNWDKDF